METPQTVRSVSASTLKKDALILLLLCLCVNVVMAQWYDAKVGVDSKHYLLYSQRILEKGALFVELHYFWYLGYVLFVTVAKSLWNDIQMIVLLQILFHAIGVAALYYSSRYLFNNRLAAWGAALLLMLWPDMLFWNFMVMTESFCTSFTCLVILLLVLHVKKQWPMLWLLPAILLLFFIRPTGIAVLVAFGLMLASIYQLYLVKYRTALVIVGLALVAGLYLLINGMLDTFVLVENYATGEIVYLAASLPDNYPGKEMILLAPQDLTIPDAGLSPVVRLLLFIVYNPWYFAKLSGMKLFYFLTHTKPYYSPIHNLLLLLVLLPLYFSTAKTIISNTIMRPLRVFLITFFVVHCVIILFTIEDWDGRFLMPLLPFVFLLGSRGMALLCQQYSGVCLEAVVSGKQKVSAVFLSCRNILMKMTPSDKK